MESQPQNPEFRINPENFHPCESLFHHKFTTYLFTCLVILHALFLLSAVLKKNLSGILSECQMVWIPSGSLFTSIFCVCDQLRLWRCRTCLRRHCSLMR